MMSEKKVNNFKKRGKVFIQSAITNEWKSRNCELNGSFLTFYRKDKIVAVIDLEQVGDINLVRDVNDNQVRGTIFTIYLKEGRYFTIRAINAEEGSSWVHILLEVRDKLRSQISRRSRPGSFCSMPDTSKNLDRLITDLANLTSASVDNDEEDVKTYFNNENNPPSPIFNDFIANNLMIPSIGNSIANNNNVPNFSTMNKLKSTHLQETVSSPLKQLTTTSNNSPPRRVSFSFPMTDKLAIPIRSNVMNTKESQVLSNLNIANLNSSKSNNSIDNKKTADVDDSKNVILNTYSKMKDTEHITTYQENKENIINTNTYQAVSQTNNNTVMFTEEVTSSSTSLNTHSNTTIGSPTFRKPNGAMSVAPVETMNACEVSTTSISMETNTCTLDTNNNTITISKKVINKTSCYTSPIRVQKSVSSFSTQTPSYKRPLKAITNSTIAAEYNMPVFMVIILTIFSLFLGYISSKYLTPYNPQSNNISSNQQYLDYYDYPPPLSADEISEPKLLYIGEMKDMYEQHMISDNSIIVGGSTNQDKMVYSGTKSTNAAYHHHHHHQSSSNTNHPMSINSLYLKPMIRSSDKVYNHENINTMNDAILYRKKFTTNQEYYNNRKIGTFFRRIFFVPVVKFFSNFVRRIVSVFQIK